MRELYPFVPTPAELHLIRSGRTTQLRFIGDDVLSPLSERQSRRTSQAQVGDALWVREQWCAYRRNRQGKRCPVQQGKLARREDEFHYLPQLLADTQPGGRLGDSVWRSADKMPQNACRLLLGVVRAGRENLQDITNEDALASGMPDDRLFLPSGSFIDDLKPDERPPELPRNNFAVRWNLRAPRGSRWEDNPRVTRIEFVLEHARIFTTR